VLQFAIAKAGAILVTANTSLRGRDVDYLLRQSEAATLIAIRGFRDVDYVDELVAIGATAGRIPGIERLIFIPRPTAGRATPDVSRRSADSAEADLSRRSADSAKADGDPTPPGFIPYDDLRVAAAQVSEEELDARSSAIGPDEVINMQYTSGTTGFPKGVMLSSRNIVNNGEALGRVLGYTPEDRLCLCVPLFHCFGCVIGVLGAFTHGACLCPVVAFDAKQVLETVHRERCSSPSSRVRTLHGSTCRRCALA
jgi:fatty-acyl-CoA synthase